MRSGALLSLALIAVLALAGCAGKTESPTTGASSAASSGTGTDAVASSNGETAATGTASGTTASGTTGATTTAGSSANRAPVIQSLKADAAGLAAVFTFNATDADKDALTFTLNFGDASADATGSIPKGNVTHAFAAAGNYTAKLTVSDGKLSVNKTLLVKIVAAAVGAAAPPQTFSGSTTVSVGSCPEAIPGVIGTHPYDPYPGTPLEGVEWLAFEVRADTVGMPFTWSNGQVVPLIWGVLFTYYDANDDLLSSDISGAGTVPVGAALGVFYPCGPGPIDVTYTAG